jgi:serine phosphatase RsbU (regulator of sigma subunit)
MMLVGPRIASFRRAFERASGHVRWKMAAIIILMGSSTVLFSGLAVVIVNVVVRRESANVAEKQIQTLVQASGSIAPAVLDNVDGCSHEKVNSEGLRPLLAYTREAFPGARVSLRMDDSRGTQLLPPQTNAFVVVKPDWIQQTAFTGLVADNGKLEIRNLAERKHGQCSVTAVFQLPLGSEMARRLSAAAKLEISPVHPKIFRAHRAMQRVFRTIDSNFIPGASAPVGVVLSARDWNTGALQDWIVYTVRPGFSQTFADLTMLGGQRANWVWVLFGLSLSVLLMSASGAWIGIRLSRHIVMAIDDLSLGAREIAAGNLAYRMSIVRNDQFSDLGRDFNEMAAGLERLQQEELARERLEGEMDLARKVQDHLYPRSVPRIEGATVAGRTQPARLIGGDLYDFFDLGEGRVGVLCADVSGKGIPAALMMANLQAIARAYSGRGRCGGPSLRPGEFVETLNQELAGRFGDNRYATLFWCEYDAKTRKLQYINAGNPSPILIRSNGAVERLQSDGFPIGMFGSAKYSPQALCLTAGSRLIMFSDGLTDALNVHGEEFGDERVVQCCLEIGPDAEAKDIAEMLTRAAAEWSAGVEPFDDTTLVVFCLPA